MKHRPLATICFVLLAGCSASLGQHVSPCSAGVPPQAVYLVSGEPGIPADELAQLPQVCVVRAFEDLQVFAVSPIAIWIDQDAVQLVDIPWLQEPPQRYYPVVLVGYGTDLYAFRELMGLPIGGPAVDWSTEPPRPGFSVWLITDETPDSQRAEMKGYEERPSGRRILELTNEMLQRAPGRRTPMGHLPSEGS